MLFIRHAAMLLLLTALVAVLMLPDRGLPAALVFRRLRKWMPFLLLMLLTLALSDGLPPSAEALRFAGCVCGRVVLAAAVVTALLGGQPASVCLQRLAALPVSPRYLSILFLADRYAQLLCQEIKIQWAALRARMFVPKVRPAVLKNTGYVLGGLFIRGYDRSSQIYEGMRARCYAGRMPCETAPSPSLADGLKTVGSLLVMGLAIYADRAV